MGSVWNVQRACQSALRPARRRLCVQPKTYRLQGRATIESPHNCRHSLMTFPPEDIETRRFVPAFRGYDRDEVDSFLRAVAADYRKLLARVSSQPASAGLVIEIRLPPDDRAASMADADEAQAELLNRMARLRDQLRRLNWQLSIEDGDLPS